MTENGSLRRRLLGPWRLAAWEAIDDELQIDSPVGEDFAGQLMYDNVDDRVSVHLVGVGQSRFISDDWRSATEEEMVSAWPTYLGYWGRFTVDEQRSIVTHHIEAASFPNLAGVDDMKSCAFDEHRLVLESDTDRGMSRLTWVRFS